MMSNRIIINDAPDHIKEWYKTEASNYGRGLSPYILHLLCDLAYANGCPKPTTDESKADKKKIKWNDFGEPIEE